MTIVPGGAREPERSALGWRLEERGVPWVGRALAGGGGALVGIGVVSVGADFATDDGSGTIGVLLCALLGVVALAVMAVAPATTRSAAVSALAIAVAGVAGFAVLPDADRPSDARTFFVLAILGWAVTFVVGPARGRLLLLGLALAGSWLWITAEAADYGESAVSTFAGPAFGFDPYRSSDAYSDEYSDGTYDDLGRFSEPDDRSLEIGIVSSLFAAGYLAALRDLDRRGRRGLATAFVVPGALALVTGVSALGDASGELLYGALIAVVAGLGCALAGVPGERRFTVWFGALVATVGALLVAGDVTDRAVGDDADNPLVVFGLLAAGFGAAVVALAEPLARVLGEPRDDRRSDGGGPAAEPAGPPGPWTAPPAPPVPPVPPVPS